MSHSKKLTIFLFCSCAFIEILVAYVTIENLQLAATHNIVMDYSPLMSLISAIVGQVITYAIYSLKSVKENTAGGIVYDSVMKNIKSRGASKGL